MEIFLIWNTLLTLALFVVHIKSWSAKNMSELVSRDLEKLEREVRDEQT